MKRPEDDKEFMEVVGHLISHHVFKNWMGLYSTIIRHTFEHSVNVSYTSYKIAKNLAGMPRVLLEAVSYMIFLL